MSFLSSFISGGGGGSAAKYAKTQSGLVRSDTALVGGLNDAYGAAARAGAWDPGAQLDRLGADTAYQNGIDLGNSAAAARTMGYRPGDTAPIDAANAINARSRLDYADAANRIRTSALQSGWQAAQGLAGESSSIYGQAAAINAPLVQYGEQQDARQGQAFGSLLGAAMPFLGPGGLAAKAVGSLYGRAAAGPDLTKTDGYSVHDGQQWVGPFSAGRVLG